MNDQALCTENQKSEDTTPLLPLTGESLLPTRPPFLLRLSPVIRLYLELIRIEKPTGIVLMLWPFVWSLTMAAYREKLPMNVYGLHIVKFFFSAFILRSSACTINDILDREMDAGVGRCRNRPLPSGRISVRSAVGFLLIQYTIGVVFFYCTLHDLALWVALFQLLPLFMIYPLLKRYTHWPQAWLGLAMNFGFITAWIATVETPDYAVLSMGICGCWCWTMLYDTVYACQDIKDDIKVGVRSTAILFGSWIRPLLVCCGTIFVATFTLAGYTNDQGPAYYLIAVGGTVTHLIWQYFTVNLDDPKSCWRNFVRNGQLGWIIWAGLMIDYLVIRWRGHT